MWFYEHAGKEAGPVDESTIQHLIDTGLIIRATKVWKEGMPDWQPASETNLANLFRGPPPLSGTPVNRNASTVQPTISTDHSVRPLKPLADHVKVAVWWTLASGALSIVGILWLSGYLTQLESGEFSSQQEALTFANDVDHFKGLADGLNTIVGIVSAIVVLRWTYFAMKNVRSRGYATSITAGWAVGWYFIPIANLWKPYLAMREIWLSSHGKEPLSSGSVPGKFTWWWLLFVGGNVIYGVGLLAHGAATKEMNTTGMTSSLSFMAIGEILYLVSAFLLLSIVKTISVAQDSENAE
jgi:hypothetical protein